MLSRRCAFLLATSVVGATVTGGLLIAGAQSGQFGHRAFAPGLAADSATGQPISDCPQLDAYGFEKALLGPASSLTAAVEQLNRSTGQVVITGGDARQPQTPFTFSWGDGTQTTNFFPTSHVYGNTGRDYLVVVTADYGGGSTDSVTVRVRFRMPAVEPVALDQSLAVIMPSAAPTLGTRLYSPPAALTGFDSAEFGELPRATAEYVLTIAAVLQRGYANDNLVQVDGGFRQVILRDAGAPGGMYSLWFTTPIAVAVGGEAMPVPAQFSSLFHEMGHNVTLNTPAEYQFGGRIDGPANAIYSETMAQLFQHVTAWELVRDGARWGLDCAVREDIAASADSALTMLRLVYDAYVSAGKQYSSWNLPETPEDETAGTFMALAYKFVALTVTEGRSPALALRGAMGLLQTFDEELHANYDQSTDSRTAATFRSTLMVAAISAGFDEDVRSEFRSLGFPIDDAWYSALRARK